MDEGIIKEDISKAENMDGKDVHVVLGDIDSDGLEDLSQKALGVKRKKGHTAYCHFSFRRPRGAGYGIFAVAFYSTFESKPKNLILYKTRKYPLWLDHQFITSIQSYWHALLTIYEYQPAMREANISTVMLVTDNSILAGWIENHRKNRDYYQWMEKAVKPFRIGGPKEILLGVGLCEVQESEKAYKFCKDELVSNNYDSEVKKAQKLGKKELKSGSNLERNLHITENSLVPSPREALALSYGDEVKKEVEEESSNRKRGVRKRVENQFDIKDFKSIIQIINQQDQ